MIYLFECILFNYILSFFAKPNFIVYDEWFDEDFENPNLSLHNKKIKTISNIHEFFYEQSNHKLGASENRMQLEIKINEKKLITNNYTKNISEKIPAISNKKFSFLEKKHTKDKLKLSITKRLIYSLSILSFLLICVFFITSIKQSGESEQSLSKKLYTLEKIS